jgi:tetratricopeptide (TPR) repeat protein
MRKPSPHPQPRLDDLPIQELATRGNALLAAHAYKDAIEVYKNLLKREPRGDWRTPLATAYLERARQLAGKAMCREAAVLWENIPVLCGQAPHPDLYVDWLLRTGQHAKAMRAYATHAAALAEGDRGDLDSVLAVLALSGQKEVLQALPPDAPLRQHLVAAQAALQAYCQGGGEAEVRPHLQAISFRSPYRDLRQVLGALLKLDSDPTAATALLERIPPHSPYQALAEVIRACTGGLSVPVLLALDPAQRELASTLLGLDPRQLKLLKQWSQLGDKPSDKAKFEFITGNLALFDRERARRACLALLPVYPHGLRPYTTLFGPLPPFELHRLQALRAEWEHNLDGTLQNWRTCANLLKADTGNPDGRLMAALILRHLVERLERVDGHDTEQRIGDYLEESLRLDPDDRDSYLKLATRHQQAGNDKEYHQWVERAVKRFPNDSQVLLAAVATATARKAHKKAAGFAARVLELDPINSKARNVLMGSHLAHTRKLIQAGKYPLAEKELDTAGRLEREHARSGLIEINRGLLAFHQERHELLRQALQEATRLIGSPLLAWLRLAVEAYRLDLEPTAFFHYLALPEPSHLTATRSDLLALVQIVNGYREEGVDCLIGVLENMEKPLKRAIKALDNADDLLALCECLLQVPHYELLEYAATGALKHQPQRPLFVYYQVYGRAEGDLENVKDRDYDRLEDALEQAHAAKDARTGMLIDRFLSQDLFPKSPGHDWSDDDELPMPPGLPAELKQMRQALEQMDPKKRERLLDAMLEDMPPDADGFPPELRKAILRAVLLDDFSGDNLGDLLESLEGLPPPGHGRGKSRKRRSR